MKKKLDLIPPGTILLEEFMEPLGISAYRLSKEIKVQQTAVSQIIKGERRITVDMALRLSKYFENTAQFWLNLQNHYDLESEKEKKEYIINDIVPYSQVAEKTPVYAQAAKGGVYNQIPLARRPKGVMRHIDSYTK